MEEEEEEKKKKTLMLFCFFRLHVRLLFHCSFFSISVARQ